MAYIDELRARNAELETLKQSIMSGGSDQNTGFGGDILTDLERGALQLPAVAGGVLDLAGGALFNARPGTAIREFASDVTGLSPSEYAEELRAEYSPGRQAALEEIQQAEGFLGTTGAYLSNPSALAGVVAESLPSMALGGFAGKGLQALNLVKSPVMAAGAGEGLVSAGGQMSGLLEESPDIDTRRAALASAATGAVVGATGVAGGTLAQKMKLIDPDLVAVGVFRPTRPAEELVPAATRVGRIASTAGRVAQGGIQEAAEEGVQSAGETVLSNLALGKDLTEGLSESVATGMLAGGALGGGLNIFKARPDQVVEQEGEEVPETPAPDIETAPTPKTLEEVMPLAKAAGFDPNTDVGQKSISAIANTPGDAEAVISVAKTAYLDEFAGILEATKEKKGIGKDKTEKIDTWLGEIDTLLAEGNWGSVADIDAKLSDLRLPTSIKESLKNTTHYQRLVNEEAYRNREGIPTDETAPQATQEPAPAPAEAEPAVAPAETEAVRDDYNYNVLPENAAVTPEEQKEKRDLISAANIPYEEETEAATTAPPIEPLTLREKGKKAGVPKKVAQEAEEQTGYTATELKGLAGLMNGFTTAKEVEATVKEKNRAAKDVKARFIELKKALPEYYTENGKLRKGLSSDKNLKELFTFLDSLPAIGDKFVGDKRMLAGVRKRAEALAEKYNKPALAKQVNKLMYGYQLLDSAKAIKPVRQEVLNTLRNLGMQGADADFTLNAQFAVLHDLLKNYDIRVSELRRAESNMDVSDFNPEVQARIDAMVEKGDLTGAYESIAEQQERAAKTITGDDVVVRGKPQERNLFALAEAIRDMFIQIEAQVGRDNMRRAMGVNIGSLSKTRKALPGVKAVERNSPEAIRFNQMYSQFMNTGTIDPRPSRQPIRHANEIAKQRASTFVDKAGNKKAYKPVIFRGDGTISRQERQPALRLEENILTKLGGKTSTPPAVALLRTISRHTMNAVAGRLAGRLERVLKASNYAEKIDVVLYPQDTSDDGAAGGFTGPRANRNAVIHLWANGQRESTILHEVMHAITMGLKSQWQNDPNSVPKDVQEVFRILDAQRREIVSALKGQRKHTGRPLPGRLNEILMFLDNPRSGLDEYITYAMTDNHLQDWMRNHLAPENTRLSRKILNYWNAFTGVLKRLFSLQTMSELDQNNILNAYLDATAVLMQRADAQAREQGNIDTFIYVPPPSPDIDPFNETIEGIIAEGKGKGIGDATAARLRSITESSNQLSQEGIDSVIDSLRIANPIKESIKAQVQDTALYKNAPKTVTTPVEAREDDMLFEKVDPRKGWSGKESRAGATQAMEDRERIQNENRAKRAKENIDQEKTQRATRAAIVNLQTKREERLQQEQVTAVEPRDEDSALAKFQGAVGTLDKLEQSIANGVLNTISGGKYKNFEEFMTNRIEAAQQRGVELTAKDDYILQTIGKVLSKTVDQYGVPVGMRNMMASFEHAFTGKVNEALTAFENLLGLTVEQQQAMLDYIIYRNHEQLKANLPKESQYDTVVNTVAALDNLLEEAKEEGIVDLKYIDYGLSDFLDLSSDSFKIVTKTTFSAIRPVEGKDNVVKFRHPVEPNRMFDAQGQSLATADPDTLAGKEFLYGVSRSRQGETFFVEVGADTVIWDDLGIAPPEGYPELEYPFRVDSVNNRTSDYNMVRRISVAERLERTKNRIGESKFNNNPKLQSVVASALTRTVQEWNRNIEGRRIIRAMVEMNEATGEDAIPENAKWITNEKPADVPESRVIRVTGDKRDLSRAKQIRSRLRVPGNWAQIDDTPENRRVFGDLAGRFVAGPAYSAILDYNDTTRVVNNKLYRTAMTVWKKTKTVFAPVAHVNNIISNVVLAYYYDIPYENLVEAHKVIWFRVKHPTLESQKVNEHKLTPNQRKLLKEMDEMGLTLAQAKTADFDLEAEQDFANWITEQRARFTGNQLEGLSNFFAKAEEFAFQSAEVAANLYSNQDNLFRLAMYMTHIQNSGKLGADGDVGIDVKQEAARKAESAFVDYRIHAPFIKGARETAFPFIAWPYRMLPLLAKVMITKPWKALNTAMAVTAINTVAYSMLGYDDDEEAYEESLVPEWYQNGVAWMPWVPSSIRLPFGTGENAYFINLSRSIPLADVNQVGGSDWPSILTPGGPAASLMFAAVGYDPFTGKEITDGTEDTLEMLGKRGAYLAKDFLPGIVSGFNRAYERQQTTGPLGGEHSFYADLAKAMGLSVYQVNKPESTYYKDLNRQRVTRTYKSAISRRWREELRYKRPDYDSAIEDEQALQEKMIEELSRLAGME